MSNILVPTTSDILVPQNDIFRNIFIEQIVKPTIIKEYGYYQDFWGILYEDCGLIKYDYNANELSYSALLKRLGKTDGANTIPQLLGNMAEAIIVRKCNEKPAVNQKFFDIARSIYQVNDSSANYVAVGTSSHRTKSNNDYRQYYNPNDTQRDIIWVSKSNYSNQLILNISSDSGFVAGLQVKTSFDGDKYFGKDLIQNRYVVPIVYFDLNNDFRSVFMNTIANGYNGNVLYDLINAKDIDLDIYNEMLFFKDYIYALATNRLSIEQFIKCGENTPIGSAIVKTIDEHFQPNNLLLTVNN